MRVCVCVCVLFFRRVSVSCTCVRPLRVSCMCAVYVVFQRTSVCKLFTRVGGIYACVCCSTCARVWALSQCVCVLSTGSLRVRDIFILCPKPN